MQKYEKGVSKLEREILLINTHDIHTSRHRLHRRLVEYYSQGALAPNHRAMLRPKVLVLHADTLINAQTIILNLIFSGSDSLLISRVEYEHVLKQ